MLTVSRILCQSIAAGWRATSDLWKPSESGDRSVAMILDRQTSRRYERARRSTATTTLHWAVPQERRRWQTGSSRAGAGDQSEKSAIDVTPLRRGPPRAGDVAVIGKLLNAWSRWYQCGEP